MSILKAIILGVIQGVVEWLPVSSEAVISIVMTNLMGSEVVNSVNTSIWLHVGTMVAAMIYFRKDYVDLGNRFLQNIGHKDLDGLRQDSLLKFIFLTTLITGMVGGSIYLFTLELLSSRPDLFSGLTGFALFLTGILKLKSDSNGERNEPGLYDALLVGGLQGLAVIPGISRSGSTVFGLLYRDFSGREAFRLSFIISVPAVLAANIGIQIFSSFTISNELLISAVVAFLVGYISIDLVLKIAEKTAVAYLCFGLAFLSFLPILI